MKERVQDTVRGLQDLTEEERKDALSCLSKCLTKDEQLQDLEQSVRGPKKNWGEEREEPGKKAVDTLQTTCYRGTSAHPPISWP